MAVTDNYRYYLTEGDSPEREVSKEEFVRAERRAAFIDTLGEPLEPAAHSFSGRPSGVEIRGRTEYPRRPAATVSESHVVRGAVLTVHMDAADFGRLCKDYEARDPRTLARGRFWAGPGREVDGEWEWKLVYWFGENYAALLLARAYALSRGFRCEVLYDNSAYRGDGPARGWCILSDYEEQR